MSAMCVLVLQIPAQNIISLQTTTTTTNIAESSQTLKNKIDLFKRIATKHDCDTHDYEYLYGHLLGHKRLENLNLLEIGLGCYTCMERVFCQMLIYQF